jgi:hypothetical protein
MWSHNFEQTAVCGHKSKEANAIDTELLSARGLLAASVRLFLGTREGQTVGDSPGPPASIRVKALVPS